MGPQEPQTGVYDGQCVCGTLEAGCFYYHADACELPEPLIPIVGPQIQSAYGLAKGPADRQHGVPERL